MSKKLFELYPEGVILSSRHLLCPQSLESTKMGENNLVLLLIEARLLRDMQAHTLHPTPCHQQELSGTTRCIISGVRKLGKQFKQNTVLQFISVNHRVYVPC